MDARVRGEPELEARIRGITAVGYEELKRGSLEGGALLERLLSTDGGANNKVPIIAACFIAIVSYLETLGQERADGEVFSPMEEGLLHMFASIRGCQQGKSEGINAYYLNVLPTVNRYAPAVAAAAIAAEEDTTLQTRVEVTGVLLEEVEKMFSGQNYLMKSIVGGEEVQQASHQAGYLKNLIGHVVGLPDKLLFDAHTSLLYAGLTQISKQDALQAFFGSFLPHELHDRIKRMYDLDDAEATELLVKMGVFRAL